jgi:hypothetical protein
MNYITRSYPVLLVMLCICLLLLVASYALAMLPSTTARVTPGQQQVPDLVANLTPNARPHYPMPTHAPNMSINH